MYLWYFERIVRKMAGNPQWALPYWNYEPATQRKLPAPFRSPATTANPLYTGDRGFGWNDGTSELGDSAVAAASALAEIPFDAFSGSLEGTPHAAIHISINGWMGDVETAAQDPIFWLHHCNIDRLWNVWLAQGGGRSDPLNDTEWKTTKFTFFDENGTQVQLTGCEVVRAAKQLNYVYQEEPTQVEPICIRRIRIPRWVKEIVIPIPRPADIGPGPRGATFDIDVRELRGRLSRIAAQGDADLLLEFTEVEADRQPDVYYEVYVGSPAGATPRVRSPHYVGNLALFGHGIRGGHGHGEFRPASFSFKIDRAVAAALARRDDRGRLTVQFVPRGPARRGEAGPADSSATIRIGAAAISVRRPAR